MTLFPQGQTAFDVADEDVLGYLEELQKKQNLVSVCVAANCTGTNSPLFKCWIQQIRFCTNVPKNV